MAASLGHELPSGRGWTFEPKYDGMRVLAFVDGARLRLVTRNGRDKAAQFPEVVAGLAALARRAGRPLVLDGEIVAIHRDAPGEFQALQGRMHLRDRAEIARRATTSPAALVVFDLLRDGDDVLLEAPWTTRRMRLEQVLERAQTPTLRLGATARGGRRMLDRARAAGWEGILAKRTDATYQPGSRSPDWLKLKLLHRAEFVVGGYTEPRGSRAHLGAILLGYFDEHGKLRYVGHTGGGFDLASLEDMHRRLARLQRRTSPFAVPPRTNEPAHWVTPRVVVEVKYAEFTADGRLRQPIFLGVRDDKDAREVTLEGESLQRMAPDSGRVRRRERSAQAGARSRGDAVSPIEQLERIEREGGEGTLDFGRGRQLHVSSLGKAYFPRDGITKGELMRYYALVSPMLLPLLRDRPLALKRYPDGIEGPSFFQQNAGARVPRGVRTAEVETAEGLARRLIGGDLLTLLYTVQFGTIAVHPWLSRIESSDDADFSVIDLDPGPGVAFTRVVELARLIGDAIRSLGLHAAVKTSGSRGMHVVIPLPRKTSYATALSLADGIARRVSRERPELATTQRRLGARPEGTIYVDAQQNARGKSMVSAYSVRAHAGATVSAPLEWRELTARLRLEAFTVRTMPRRLARVGDLWAPALARRNRSRAVARAVQQLWLQEDR